MGSSYWQLASSTVMAGGYICGFTRDIRRFSVFGISSGGVLVWTDAYGSIQCGKFVISREGKEEEEVKVLEEEVQEKEEEKEKEKWA